MGPWQRLLLAAGLLSVTVAVSVPVFAQSAPASTTAAHPPHPPHRRSCGPLCGRRLAGVITAVSGSSVTLRSPKGKTLTISLTPKASVAENGQEVSPAALSSGQDALFLRVHRHKGVLVSPAVIVGTAPIAMPRHARLRHLGKVSTTGNTLTFANGKGPIATFTPSGAGGNLTITPPGKPSKTIAVFRTIVHVGKGQTALSDVTAGDFATLRIRPTRLGPRDILFLSKHPLHPHRVHHPKSKSASPGS